MVWILEDEITSESVFLRRRGQWRIGRGESDSTVVFYQINPDYSLGDLEKLPKIKIPITDNPVKVLDILKRYGSLAPVSREHGIIGIDRQGAYFIDTSSNGTFVKNREKPCTKGSKTYLSREDILSLGGIYPLKIYQKTMRDRFKSFFFL